MAFSSCNLQAKHQQQTGRDSTTKHCNALLFLSLCLKENIAVTYHFAILNILEVQKIIWSLNIHTLPCWCLWARGYSYYYVILFHVNLGFLLSHQNRHVLALYSSEDLLQ